MQLRFWCFKSVTWVTQMGQPIEALTTLSKFEFLGGVDSRNNFVAEVKKIIIIIEVDKMDLNIFSN